MNTFEPQWSIPSTDNMSAAEIDVVDLAKKTTHEHVSYTGKLSECAEHSCAACGHEALADIDWQDEDGRIFSLGYPLTICEYECGCVVCIKCANDGLCPHCVYLEKRVAA